MFQSSRPCEFCGRLFSCMNNVSYWTHSRTKFYFVVLSAPNSSLLPLRPQVCLRVWRMRQEILHEKASQGSHECKSNELEISEKFYIFIPLKVHKGQKDFGCSYCEKSYFFQSHLKRHILSTHMKLKIDCEVLSCSSSFARKETYRNHVLQHHQNIGQEALNLLLMKIRNMKVEEYRCVGWTPKLY